MVYVVSPFRDALFRSNTWKPDCVNFFWTGQVDNERVRRYPEFIQALNYNNDPIAAFSKAILNH
jgi:hypothetical protein